MEGNFRFEVEVVGFTDPVDDCGGGADVCALYIERICLDPQTVVDYDCSLGEISNDLDLESNLPKSRTLTVNNRPWPVSVNSGTSE